MRIEETDLMLTFMQQVTSPTVIQPQRGFDHGTEVMNDPVYCVTVAGVYVSKTPTSNMVMRRRLL